jgi:hypothetical protein
MARPFSFARRSGLTALVIVLLSLLLLPAHAMANVDGPAPSTGGCGQNPVVESTGLVLGGVAGAVLVGGGMAGWALASLNFSSCQGPGCEGPAGLLLLSPIGALAGAVGGALVGYLFALVTFPADEPVTVLARDVEDDP